MSNEDRDTIVTVLTGDDALQARIDGAIGALRRIARLPHEHVGYRFTQHLRCARCLAEGALVADGSARVATEADGSVAKGENR